MSFNYEYYLYANLTLPATLASFTLTLLCVSLFAVIRGKKGSPYKTLAQRFAAALFGLIIFGVLSFINLRVVSLYGVKLYRDRDTQPIEYCGTIEEIIPSTSGWDGQKYHTSVGTSFGATMVIDGERFHVMTAAGFEEGETVRVLYLPNSHCIVEIHEADETD